MLMHDLDVTSLIYKILHRSQWESAIANGFFAGSPDDERDGFIHLSTGSQLTETARRYFSNQPDQVLVAFEAQSLGGALRWEPSRGGALFPHLYAPLPAGKALWVVPLPLDDDGVPIMPAGIA
jgi:uncharacterized protein (DUF952 family)